MQTVKKGTTIAHIGIAVRSLGDSMSIYRDVLGLPDVPVEDSDGAKIAAVAAGASLLEFLEPAIPGSPIDKFIGKRGPGIHHICFAVDDLDATLDRCRANGIRMPPSTATRRALAFMGRLLLRL